MRRRPSLITVAAVPVLLGLIGNLATGTVRIPGRGVPLLWATTAALAMVAVIIEVVRQRADERPPAAANDPLVEHFRPRGQGVLPTTVRRGWYFTGRAVVLRELVAWLNCTDHGAGSDVRARIVTGGPGAGKSAVLGRLVSFATPTLRSTIPAQEFADAAPGTVPPAGAVRIAVHARGRTLHEVAAQLAAGFDIDESTVVGLLAALRSATRHAAVGVVVDALDEAADPRRLITDLLEPLAAGASATGIRLMVGTRPGSGGALLRLFGAAAVILDLDSDRYLDHADVVEYVRRSLLAAGDPQLTTPYRGRPQLAATVASVVAGRAGSSFLVAQLTSLALAAAPTVVGTAELAAPDQFPATVGEAMERYIHDAGPDGHRVRDLLMPLAWAQGDGLANPGLWAALASALSGDEYREHDIARLVLDSPAVDLLHRSETTHEVRYRLFHEALGEHLRSLAARLTSPTRIQARFTRVLLDRVPCTAAGSRNWPASDEYTCAYLAVHAREGHMIDQLLDDAGYLAIAEPGRLLTALKAVTTERGRHRATIIEHVGQQLLSRPHREQVSYLEMAARLHGDRRFADELAALNMPRIWSVPWARWCTTSPGRVLGHHGDWVHTVTVATVAGQPIVVSASDWTIAFHPLADGASTVTRWREHRTPIIAITAIGHEQQLLTVVLHADGELHRIATFGSDHTVDTLPGRHRCDGVWTVRHCDRDVVATADSAGRLQLTDVFTGDTQTVAMAESVERILTAATLPASAGGDYTLAVAEAADGTIQAWDVATGAAIGAPLDPRAYSPQSDSMGYISSAKFLTCRDDTPTVLLVLAASYSGRTTEVIWQPETGQIQANSLEWTNVTAALELPPTGRICYADAVGNLHLATEPAQRLHAHESLILSLALVDTDHGPALVSGGQDGAVRLWPLTSTIDHGPHPEEILPLSQPVQHEGRRVVLCQIGTTSLALIDASTGETVEQVTRSHPDGIQTAALDRDHNVLLVTTDEPTTIVRTSLKPEGCKAAIVVDTAATITQVVPVEDHGVLLVAADDGMLHVLDAASGIPRQPGVPCHTGGFGIVSHADDANIAATWAWRDDSPDAIKLLQIGQEVITVSALPLPDDGSGPFFGVLDATIAAVQNRNVLVAVGWQSTIHTWDLDRGTHSTGIQFKRTAERSLNAVAGMALGGRQHFLCGGFQCALVAWRSGATQCPEIIIGSPILGIQQVHEREVLVAGPRSLLLIRIDDSFLDDTGEVSG